MDKATKRAIDAGYKPGYTSGEYIQSYTEGYYDAVNDVFNYLKENYKIKSKETIEFLVPDMVKKDFLNSE